MRIPIRYGNPWKWLLPLFLLPARLAYIRIDGDSVRVRMAWGFRIKFPKASVQAVSDHRPVVSIGAHGWKGRWLVNGAHRPIARITFAIPVRARVLGFGVQLRELLVSVDDVAELQRALLT